MRAFLIASFFSVIMVVGLFITGINWLLRKNVDPVIADHISIQAKILNDYFADNDFLRNQKIFSSLFGSTLSNGPEAKDAGPILNFNLHWLPEQPGFAHPAMVPADIQDFILRLGRNWSLHTSPFKVFFERKRIDLRIFKVLSQFSYWDVEKNSPIAHLVKENTHIATDALPSLDSLDLIALAKLRLIEAIFTKDHLSALKEVRKLVELLLTTENYRLELTAIAILEAEHSAYNLYVSNHWINAQDWIPVDSNGTRRANRAMKATKELLRFWTPVSVLKQVYLGRHNPIGFCAGIGDTFSKELSVRKEMTGTYAFERDYKKHFEVFDDIWKKATSSCHLDYLTAAQASGHFEEANLPGSVLAYLPYSNKLFGLSQSANLFEGFKDYIDPNPHATN